MSFQIIQSEGSIYVQKVLRPKLKQLTADIDALKAQCNYEELMNEFLEKLKLKSDEISNQLTEQTVIKIDKIADDVLKNVTETLNSSDVLESVQQEIKDLLLEVKQVTILVETTKQEIKKLSDQIINDVKNDIIKNLLESEDFLSKLKHVLIEEHSNNDSTLHQKVIEILKIPVKPLQKSIEVISDRIKDLKLQLPTVINLELQKELKDLIKDAESVSAELLTEIINVEDKLSDVLSKVEEISQDGSEKVIKNKIYRVEENLKGIVKNINLDDKIKENLTLEMLKNVDLDTTSNDFLKDASSEEYIKKELTPEVLKDMLKNVDLRSKVTEALKDADLEEHIKKELTPEVLKDMLKNVDLRDMIKANLTKETIEEALKEVDLSAKIKESIETDESIKNLIDDLTNKLKDNYTRLLNNRRRFNFRFNKHM
ncbi:hypothetical protein KM759_gp001 [Lymphocystis disease virus 4]|uniref:Uncharacterized protein n=1 Tax=Lymphocystis disease virus 4 TaxID=2704413 RepID=A0A6B9XMU7_9VIRU|nr:hypothetical protein KM759_gp001 [Lymphocystis disease virus 4]QHR78458.1 hypothetical protein [Lymphocystis disease virus 4]